MLPSAQFRVSGMRRHLLWLLLAAACLALLPSLRPLARLPAHRAPHECPASAADMGSHDGKLQVRRSPPPPPPVLARQ